MKIAICFWGLTRSLKYTIDSINQYILDVLKTNQIEYKIFMHTYILDSTYNNVRAGEKDISLNNYEYKLLTPDYIFIDNQDDVKSQIDFHSYRTHKDPWNTNYQTMDNFILAMYSKKQLLKLFNENNDNTFTHFLMLRPDVKYINSLDIEWLTSIKNNEIYVPCFHYKYWGFNDRMALISNKEIFIKYNSIFDYMLSYSKKKELHSESINLFIMKCMGISINPIPFFFNRVRANGNTSKDVTIDKNGSFKYL